MGLPNILLWQYEPQIAKNGTFVIIHTSGYIRVANTTTKILTM